MRIFPLYIYLSLQHQSLLPPERMESSDPNLRPRPPKARKKRRKHSSPVESPSPAAPVPPTEKYRQIKDSIRVRRPQRPTTPTNSLFTPTNFNFSSPRFPALWEGPQYLLMLNRALQLTMRALQLHSKEYANSTNKQIQERRFLDQIHQSLEKLTTGQLEEDPSPQPWEIKRGKRRCVYLSTRQQQKH